MHAARSYGETITDMIILVEYNKNSCYFSNWSITGIKFPALRYFSKLCWIPSKFWWTGFYHWRWRKIDKHKTVIWRPFAMARWLLNTSSQRGESERYFCGFRYGRLLKNEEYGKWLEILNNVEYNPLRFVPLFAYTNIFIVWLSWYSSVLACLWTCAASL